MLAFRITYQRDSDLRDDEKQMARGGVLVRVLDVGMLATDTPVSLELVLPDGRSLTARVAVLQVLDGHGVAVTVTPELVEHVRTAIGSDGNAAPARHERIVLAEPVEPPRPRAATHPADADLPRPPRAVTQQPTDPDLPRPPRAVTHQPIDADLPRPPRAVTHQPTDADLPRPPRAATQQPIDLPRPPRAVTQQPTESLRPPRAVTQQPTESLRPPRAVTQQPTEPRFPRAPTPPPTEVRPPRAATQQPNEALRRPRAGTPPPTEPVPRPRAGSPPPTEADEPPIQGDAMFIEAAEPSRATGASTPSEAGNQAAKIQLALHGNRDQRNAILRDTNRTLYPYVLKNPQLTTEDVLAIAKNAQMTSDVLKMIAERREWFQRPQIATALARNPKTPADVAVRALDYVAADVLRQLAKGTGALPHVVQAARKKVIK